MKSYVINNYRMGGYLLLAVGLINLRYQTGQSEILKNSLLIILPGVLILIATWIPAIAKMLLPEQAAERGGPSMQLRHILVGVRASFLTLISPLG